MKELVDVEMKYKIKIPKEYAVLSKGSATPEGIIRQLDPELDITEVALPYAKQLLYDRYNPGSMSGGFLRVLLQLQGFLQDTPQQLSQILMDLEGGKFRYMELAAFQIHDDTPQQLSQILMDLEGGKFHVTVRNEELSKLNTNVKTLGILLFAGMIAASLIVGAFSLVGRGSGGSTPTWPIAALVGLALAAMLFGAAVTWTLISGRLKKISVRRFFK